MSTPVNSLIAAIDSHYLAVKARIQTLNPNRKVLGVMDSMDWPPLDVQMEALYCLALGEVPMPKESNSIAVPIVVHTVQWTWIIQGMEVQKGIQIRSRGNRYRVDGDIKKELMYGIFPCFAQKMQVTVNPDGSLLQTPVDPTEYIVWSPVTFAKRSDKVSGSLYGIATTHITNMTDTIQAS